MKYILTIILALFTFNTYAVNMKSGSIDNMFWVITYEDPFNQDGYATYRYNTSNGLTDPITLTEQNDGGGTFRIDVLTEAEFKVWNGLVGDTVESGLAFQELTLITSSANDSTQRTAIANKIRGLTHTGLFNSDGTLMNDGEGVRVAGIHDEQGLGGETANLRSIYRPDSGKTNSIFWAHDIHVEQDFIWTHPSFESAYMSSGNENDGSETSSTVIEIIIAADLVKSKFDLNVTQTKEALMATLDADRRINILAAQSPIGNID